MFCHTAGFARGGVVNAINYLEFVVGQSYIVIVRKNLSAGTGNGCRFAVR
jgi:hypothetical protein